MKRHFRNNPEDASALILTLLVIVLLSTIVTSFLSTSRTEQTATRNYTSKTQAEQFAESATQQAMAQIQKGFTTSSNATTVITTQPGRIQRFVFSNGSINATDSNSTSLFSGSGNNTSNVTVNLNNLQNPSSNSNATTDQWTITGNLSEQINVFMENITTSVNGVTQLVGRIAYYVDDEGTKLNANSAIGNRTTLNAASRPQDIGALVSAAQATAFSGIVNNSTSNVSSITGWSYFFRPEQVVAAVNGISGNYTPFISTASSYASTTANMSHLLTPWGGARLYINELPITTAGVNRTFTALTGNASTGSTAVDLLNGQALQNIFGGNFSTKYTALGVKQIAANMLQMRDPNTFSINASGNYSGALLGANNLDAINIPMEYLGYAPYPVISEIGFSSEFTFCHSVTTTNSTNATTGVVTTNQTFDPIIRINTQPTVELYNPYPVDFVFNSGYPRLIVEFSAFSVDINYTYPANGTAQTRTINSTIASSIPNPPFTWTGFGWNPQLDDTRVFYDALPEFLPINAQGKPYIPAQTKIQTHFMAIFWGIRSEIGMIGGRNMTVGSTPPVITDYPVLINSFSNYTINIRSVRLLANSNNGSTTDLQAGQTSTIRDWVTGNETGWLKVDIDSNGTMPFLACWANTNARGPHYGSYVYPSVNGAPEIVPTNSASRISFLNKYPISVAPSGTSSNWYNPDPGSPTWSVNASTRFGNQGSTSNTTNPNNSNSAPSTLSNQTIPSDPSSGNTTASAVYAGSNASDMRAPELPTFSGNPIYTSPSDLGLVPTNQRWRRLRMQMQPKQEVSNTYGGTGNQTFIPDWAILDVISFGNSTNPNNAFNRMLPVNINGMFHLPGNGTIPPRTIGVKALAQVLSLGANASSSIQDTTNPTSSLYPLTGNATQRFKGTSANSTAIANIANAIGNMTWSTNSTWGNATTGKRWKINNITPINNYVLPSEIMEISGIADAVDQGDYTNSASHFKWNEGRASALIPAVTTRSSCFMIYAYAQAGQLQNRTQPQSATNPFVVDSEALTKTLVEVQYNSGNYTVKKLYTQPIPLGQ